MLLCAGAIVVGLFVSDLIAGRARGAEPLLFRRGGRLKLGI